MMLQKRIKQLKKLPKKELIDLHKRLYRVGTPELSDKDAIINDILDTEGLLPTRRRRIVKSFKDIKGHSYLPSVVKTSLKNTETNQRSQIEKLTVERVTDQVIRFVYWENNEDGIFIIVDVHEFEEQSWQKPWIKKIFQSVGV